MVSAVVAAVANKLLNIISLSNGVGSHKVESALLFFS